MKKTPLFASYTLVHSRQILPLGAAISALLAAPAAQAVDYYKANNATNLNVNASWVDAAGAAIATTPVNGTGSSDVLTWDNRVTAENTVDMGNDIGINTIRILDPGGPVNINATNRTFTVTNNGGVDMSLATQDLTLGSGIFFRSTGAVTVNQKVAAGRVLTFNGPLNVRNNATGGTVNHTGAGTTIYNGTFAPSHVVINAGEVRFNAAAGSTRLVHTTTGSTTTVNGGRLVVNNTSGSATGSGAVTINNTGTLTGQGIISGPVTLNSGATIIPNETGVGTLRTGSLNLAAGSTYKWEGIDTTQSDLVEVTVADGLTINGGTVDIRNAGTSAPFTGLGTFNLFSFNGAVSGSGISNLTVAESSKIAGQTYTFGLAGNFVTLRIEVGSRPQSFWNVNASGTWSTPANWTANGVPNAVSAIANLGGTSGATITAPRTVTLSLPTTVGVLNFDSAQPYTVAGTKILTFDDGDAAATLRVENGSHTISAPIALPANGILAGIPSAGSMLTLEGQITGDGGIGKSGAGTLILSADNYYGGITSNGAGILQLGTGGASGSVYGTISNSGILKINRSDAFNFTSALSGTGSLEFIGTGTTSLGSGTTFSGPTTISSGTVEIVDPLALQNSTLNLNTGGGTLTVSAGSVVLGGITGNGAFPLTNVFGDPISLSVGQNNSTTTYTGTPAGTGVTFTKSGTGTLSLTGTHAYSGTTSLSAGVLSLDAGSDFTTSAITLGTVAGTKLLINGGSLHTTEQSLVTNASAGIDMVAGNASFGAIVTDGNNAAGANFIRVTGGTLTATSLTMGRGALNLGVEPATGQTANGLYINGGAVTLTGTLNLGTGANSSVSSRMDSGSLSVNGAVTLAIDNPTRWSILDIAGGTFTSTDTTTGVRLGGPFVGQVIMRVRNPGTVVKAERVQFAQPDFGGTAILDVADGQTYIGAGGLVLGSADPGLFARLRLAGGTLGATADSHSTVPISLTGAATLTGADASDSPHTVTFSGMVDGSGSLTKSGSGTVEFTSPNVAFSGPVHVTAGTLGLLGQTGATTVSAGATLIPRGILSPQAASTISGTLGIRYDAANSINPGSIRSQGVLTLSPGAALNISGTGTLTAPSYILASGTSGVSGTFSSVTGLPSGYTLTYTFDDGSGFPAVAIVNGSASPYDAWASSFSLAGPTAAKTADPDQDGVKNLIEFALGTNPTQASSGPALGRSGNFLTLTFPHIAGGNLTYIIEENDDLNDDWVAVQTYSTFAAAGTTVYTDNVAIGTVQRRMLRLRVVVAN